MTNETNNSNNLTKLMDSLNLSGMHSTDIRAESGSLGETIRRAVRGRTSALNRLFSRLGPSLSRWARGRLPHWARARVDTDDLVQDALLGVLDRLPKLEKHRRRTIEAYLRRSIRNRITDEVRRAGTVEVSVEKPIDPVSESSPLTHALASEQEDRYQRALSTLSEDDRQLIVGRLGLAYSYEQLALATERNSPDAARVAVRRALLRLAKAMSV